MVDVVERRRKDRLVFRHGGGLLSARLQWGATEEPGETQQVADLNGQGLAVLLPKLPHTGSSHELNRVSLFWKGKKVGARAVESAVAERISSGGTALIRLRAIFKPPYARYYLPREVVVPAGPNKYRVDPERAAEIDGSLIRSVIGSGTLYQERRQGDRLRIPLEDHLRVELRALNKRIFPGALADISANGAAVFLDDNADLNALRTGLDELQLFVRGAVVHRKRLRRYTAIPMDVRGRRIIKLSVTFANNIRASFDEEEPAVSRENRSVRLREKALYPTLIHALVSEPTDVRFEVTREGDVLDQIYRLRYRTYLEEGKIAATDFADGRMTDRFDAVATHLCGRIGEEVVAAARIIPQDSIRKFELEESVRIPGLRKPGTRYAEVSRFCVGKFFRTDINRGLSITLRLIGEVCRVAWASKVDVFLITAYKPHVRLYESIGFRSVSDYVRLKGFHYEYMVMEWDLDPRKTAPLYRKLLVDIQRETKRDS